MDAIYCLWLQVSVFIGRRVQWLACVGFTERAVTYYRRGATDKSRLSDGPSLNKKAFSVHRPTGSKSCEYFFFFHFSSPPPISPLYFLVYIKMKLEKTNKKQQLPTGFFGCHPADRKRGGLGTGSQPIPGRTAKPTIQDNWNYNYVGILVKRENKPKSNMLRRILS